MSLLLDTHILLWAAGPSNRLSPEVVTRLEAPEEQLIFSVVSLWEIAIKSSRGRDNFRVDGAELRQVLLAAGYDELQVTGPHALETAALPAIHNDPFDRLLIAQAWCEGVTLLTADSKVARYPGPIELI
ncbi:MAG: type II toxin-antitoxin system VapC family toxin [Rhodospirillaceae bacterium]|nr:type II toxin-antitoxin system VapC family toxin [Rhodospirillaceae bacterium]MYB13403.1 type II toxin-antitoxin system VapC family toxin [Rhodospirillaceae bacterium]MYI50300.1 type II toxin-antitoxin system VapC family toxin [Rhodospirillaceae bacterium]